MKIARMFAGKIIGIHVRNLPGIVGSIFALVLAVFGLAQFAQAETIVSSDIKTGTTWTRAGSPYIVTKSIGVCHSVLVIEPGVVVKFNPGAGFDVCFGGGTEQVIKALGTADMPILFTSNQPAPAPGDWSQIHVISSEDIFQYSIFEFGGGDKNEMVLIDSASATFRNCQFKKSKTTGVRVIESSTPSITASIFLENELYGLALRSASASTVIRDNLFKANNLNPIVVDVNSLGALRSNVFSDNSPNLIQISSGTVRTNQVVANMGIPYVVSGGYIVLAGAVMTVEPGVTMQFDSGAGIVSAADNIGVLHAEGIPNNPILFTSNQRTPNPGDWGGIAVSLASTFKYCIQEYGGQDGFGIYLGGGVSGTRAALQNCSIRKNSTNGLWISGIFNSNAPLIELNNFYENQGYNLVNDSTTKIIAKSNWWGSASDVPKVAGNVDTGNPLVSPELQGFPQSPLIRYFPHFAAGGSYRTLLLLKNLEIIPTILEASFYDDNGIPKEVAIDSAMGSSHTIRIPAGGSKVVEVTGSGPNVGWIRLTPEQRIDASLIFKSLENGKVNAAAGVPDSPLVREASISVINDLGILETTAFALSNPNELPIAITLELFDQSGTKQRETVINIPPLGHLARFVHEIFTQSDVWTGTMKLSSDFGFAVLPLKFDGNVFSTISVATLR